jgi:hypothetical protein
MRLGAWGGSRMKFATRPTPAAYAELVALFPLRPLHDEVDYDNALEVAKTLVGSVDLTDDQADYLDVLTDIIQKYEARCQVSTDLFFS